MIKKAQQDWWIKWCLESDVCERQQHKGCWFHIDYVIENALIRQFIYSPFCRTRLDLCLIFFPSHHFPSTSTTTTMMMFFSCQKNEEKKNLQVFLRKQSHQTDVSRILRRNGNEDFLDPFNRWTNLSAWINPDSCCRRIFNLSYEDDLIASILVVGSEHKKNVLSILEKESHADCQDAGDEIFLKRSTNCDETALFIIH